MLSLRQAGDIEMAALNDSRPGHRDVLETAAALWNHAGRAAGIEGRQKAVAECFYFGEGMRLAALIDDRYDGALFDRQLVGLEIPARIRRPILGPHDEIAEDGRIAKGGQCDIVTKATPAFSQHSVERGRIAFVQCNDLGEVWRVSGEIRKVVWRPSRPRVCCTA